MTIAMFYQNPRPLDAGKDADLKVRKITDLGFARDVNTIPINLGEFAQAAKYYPIGFVGETAIPAAIVGLRKGNLFLDENGRWKSGVYVPAFVRRYPFMFADTAVKNQFQLCIDDTPRAVTGDEGQALFEAGKPTALTSHALEFCRAFHQGGQLTERFAKAVKDAGLLVSRQAETRLAEGTTFSLGGFQSVDPEKLRKLQTRTLGLWNERNWLAPLYAHIQSMNNWNDLMTLLDPSQIDQVN
jgi:hypothetical protein